MYVFMGNGGITLYFDNYFYNNVLPRIKTPYALLALEEDMHKNPFEYRVLCGVDAEKNFNETGIKKLKIPKTIHIISAIIALILIIIYPISIIPLFIARIVRTYNKVEFFWKQRYKKKKEIEYYKEIEDIIHSQMEYYRDKPKTKNEEEIDLLIKNLMKVKNHKSEEYRRTLFSLYNLLLPTKSFNPNYYEDSFKYMKRKIKGMIEQDYPKAEYNDNKIKAPIFNEPPTKVKLLTRTRNNNQ